MSSVRLAFLLSLVLVSNAPALHALSLGPTGTVLGVQKTIVLLVEFSDASHSKSSEAIHEMVFEEMNRYYKEASFGKISIAGKETTQWHRLPFASSAYDLATPLSSDSARTRFATDAIHEADNEVDFREYARVIVLGATSIWSATLSVSVATNDGVTVNRAVIASEFTSLAALVREYGRLLGLDYLCDLALFKAGRYPGAYLGSWDPMSNCLGFDEFGQPEKLVHFVAWNKIRLGWIERKQIEDIRPGSSRMVNLVPLASGLQGTLVVRISQSPKAYYLVEFRERIGYDANLADSGALITYYDGKTPPQVIDQRPELGTPLLNDAAFDFVAGKSPVYLKKALGFSIIVLKHEPSLLKLKISTAKEGDFAQEAANAVVAANATIEGKKDQGKTKGLEEPERLLKLAVEAFNVAEFHDAAELARRAFEEGTKATYPETHAEAKKMLNQTRSILEEAGSRTYRSQEAAALVEQGSDLYAQAVRAYEKGDWEQAIEYANKAQAVIEEASRAENEFAESLKQQESIRIAAIQLSVVLLLILVVWGVVGRRKTSVLSE